MSTRSFRSAAAFGFLLSLAFFLCLVTKCFGTRGTEGLDDVSTAVVPLAAGVLGVGRFFRSGDRTSHGYGWLCLGLSCLLWGVGGTAWAYYALLRNEAVPFPSLADVGYLAAVPFSIVALIGLGGLWSTFGGLRTLLDATLAAGAMLFVSWVTVLQQQFATATGPLIDRIIGLSYPISDVATATLALLALARVRGGHRAGMALIAVGLGAVAVSDSAFAWFTAAGDYGTGNDFDTGYVVGYVLIGLAAVLPLDLAKRPDGIQRTAGAGRDGGTGQHSGTRQDDGIKPDDGEEGGRLGMALPYLPLAVAGVATVVLHLRHSATSSFLFWDGMFLIALVLARQLLGLFANLALRRELQASLDAIRQREIALHHQAFHDVLTGLPNRAMFSEKVNEALDGHDSRSVIAMLLDLDGFKQVNDTLGHPAGDRLLVIVADRLRLCVRQEDLVARLGGDEFALLLHGHATLAEASGIAERILATLRAPADVGGQIVEIQGSLGLVEARVGDSLEDILRHVDLAMYEAKRGGKDAFVVHSFLS